MAKGMTRSQSNERAKNRVRREAYEVTQENRRNKLERKRVLAILEWMTQ